MALILYNTLTRKKEKFIPVKGKKAGFYACGPTVYWYQHIGNLRTYVSEDILKRVLISNGYEVKHIMNITDVGHLISDADEGEDKMIKAIKREGLALTKESMLKIADKYTVIFNGDLKKLNIIPPDAQPKATEHISEQIELIKTLEKKGYAYKTSVGIIFDTSKVKNYGELAKLKISKLEAGARTKADTQRKSPSDFALWITNQQNHIMQWDSPWGKGFPGWHIECSAMASKYLGKQFDIHTGGEEHVSVHHTNEIAQSEAASGKKPWVKYWIHNSWLVFKGEKMSKSKGEIYTVSALEEKGFFPLSFRYFCLNAHYKTPLNFTWTGIEHSQNAYLRLKKIVSGLKNDGRTNRKYLADFEKAINNDLDTPKALAVLWKMIRDAKAEGKIGAIAEMDKIFGLDLLKKETISVPEKINDILKKRENARAEKNWQKADTLRQEAEKLGWTIEDTSSGPLPRKK